VHRDLKPENLMVSADGRVKIADFGIAKVIDPALAGTVLTLKGTTIGTPTYMAPELAMGRDIGPWTDMYAIGVIAFELLAGRPPFDTTGTPMAILLRHVNEKPLELTSLEPSLDPRLSEWIDRLLVKEPEARRHSASAAWLAFEEIVLDLLGPRWRHAARLPAAAPAGPTPATMPMAPDETHDQRAIPTATPRAAAPATQSAVPATRSGDGRSARRLTRPILLVIALLVAVGVLALASGNGSGTSGATATPVASPATPVPSPTAPVPSPAAPVATPSPQSAPPSSSSGVGDSQSDDPSDDEPDIGEP
jgi:serine/threonine protein kinase